MSRAPANPTLFPTPTPPQLVLSLWDRVIRRIAAAGFMMTYVFAGPITIFCTAILMARLYRRGHHTLFTLLLSLCTLYTYTWSRGYQTTDKAEQKWWRRSQFFQYLIRTYDMRAYQSERLNPHGQYIFACHPHGVIPCGWMTYFQQFPTEPMVVGVGANFVVPIQREMTLFSGGIDANESTFRNVLQRGRSVCLFPGGVTEMLSSQSSDEIHVHNKNHGFIRLAIIYGVPIVPCFSYTEQYVYRQWVAPLPERFMTWFKKYFGFYIFIPRGVGLFHLFPNLDHSRVVIGRPIPVQQQSIPSSDYIAHIHTRVYRELIQLVAHTREAVGHPHVKLILTQPLPKL